MDNFISHFKNISLLLLMSIIGLIAGFALGVFWTTNQALNLADYSTAQALENAVDTIRAQAQKLQYTQNQLTDASQQLQDSPPTLPPPRATAAPKKVVYAPSQSYTGEDLMQAVNKYRREHGVPELQLQSGLCQLASRRLGEIIDLGKLDNHAGFENYFNSHEISELGVNNVAENLASGYSTAWDAVMGWDSSPPHRTFLLSDGSYKYGCGAANLGFAVLIGGY